MGLSNEPKPPVYCDGHDGIDWVDITAFGRTRQRSCLLCGGDPDVPADVIYARALAEYRERKEEYDRLTPRIAEIEAELRARA